MPYSSLTRYLSDTDTVRPIVVFDGMVYVRAIEHIYKARVKDFGEFPTETEKINFLNCVIAYKLNRGCDALELHRNEIGFSAIIAMDEKAFVGEDKSDTEGGLGYWRNIVAHELGLPFYKGGRKPKDDIVYEIKALFLDYIRSFPDRYLLCSAPLFEADDIAGAIYRLKSQGVAKDRTVFLSTLDGDWQSLVADEYKIFFVNTISYHDRVRGNEEVAFYYARKEACSLEHPSQTEWLKVAVGDSGDNLYKGTPIRLFQLTEEDEEYKIPDTLLDRISYWMEEAPKSNNVDHFATACNYLLSIGANLPEVSNVGEEYYNKWYENAQKFKKKVLDFGEFWSKHFPDGQLPELKEEFKKEKPPEVDPRLKMIL